jgi:iron(III) transport system substrate-binding protein
LAWLSGLKAEIGADSVKSQFAYFVPHDPGYVQDISGAAVVKSSKNQAAAQKFLAFLTGKSGQTIIATGDSFEYPLAAGVAANPQLPPLNTLAPNAFSVADMGTCDDAKALLQQAQLLRSRPPAAVRFTSGAVCGFLPAQWRPAR